MGKGIVVEFNKRFNMKQKYPDYLNSWIYFKIKGDCLLEYSIMNLTTKERYYQKSTYESLSIALKQMKYICEINNINKIAMPIIGCSLDRLE